MMNASSTSALFAPSTSSSSASFAFSAAGDANSGSAPPLAFCCCHRPGVNIGRVPRNGRQAEYLTGEEPALGALMAAAYVRGAQGEGVACSVKHFVANTQETGACLCKEAFCPSIARFLYCSLPLLPLTSTLVLPLACGPATRRVHRPHRRQQHRLGKSASRGLLPSL